MENNSEYYLKEIKNIENGETQVYDTLLTFSNSNNEIYEISTKRWFVNTVLDRWMESDRSLKGAVLTIVRMFETSRRLKFIQSLPNSVFADSNFMCALGKKLTKGEQTVVNEIKDLKIKDKEMSNTSTPSNKKMSDGRGGLN